MKVILKIIGIFYMLIGFILIIYPEMFHEGYNYLLTVSYDNSKWLAIPPLIFGILFVVSRRASKYPMFILVIGFLGIAKALYFFLEANIKTYFLLNWWIGLPCFIHRVWGLVAFIFGFFIAAIVVSKGEGSKTSKELPAREGRETP